MAPYSVTFQLPISLPFRHSTQEPFQRRDYGITPKKFSEVNMKQNPLKKYFCSQNKSENVVKIQKTLFQVYCLPIPECTKHYLRTRCKEPDRTSFDFGRSKSTHFPYSLNTAKPASAFGKLESKEPKKLVKAMSSDWRVGSTT